MRSVGDCILLGFSLSLFPIDTAEKGSDREPLYPVAISSVTLGRLSKCWYQRGEASEKRNEAA